MTRTTSVTARQFRSRASVKGPGSSSRFTVASVARCCVRANTLMGTIANDGNGPDPQGSGPPDQTVTSNQIHLLTRRDK